MMCKGLKSNPSVTEREGGVWRATQKISQSTGEYANVL
jgi:hypothetical protein